MRGMGPAKNSFCWAAKRFYSQSRHRFASDKSIIRSRRPKVLGRGQNITAPPLLRSAPIQCVKRKQDPTRVAPKGRFIATKTIQRQIR
jgi:hypothetical protein